MRSPKQVSLAGLLVILAICGVCLTVFRWFYREPTVLVVNCAPELGDVYLDNVRLGSGTKLEFTLPDLVRLMRGNLASIAPGEFYTRTGAYGCVMQKLRKRDGTAPLIWTPARSGEAGQIETPYGPGRQLFCSATSSATPPYTCTVGIELLRMREDVGKTQLLKSDSPSAASQLQVKLPDSFSVPKNSVAKGVVLLESLHEPFYRFLEVEIKTSEGTLASPFVVSLPDDLSSFQWIKTSIDIYDVNGKRMKGIQSNDIAIPKEVGK